MANGKQHQILERNWKVLKSRLSRVKSVIPPAVVRWIRWGESQWKTIRSGWMSAVYESRIDCAVHCSVHRCGSQWVRAMLSDPAVYKFSGLRYVDYPRKNFGQPDVRPLPTRKYVEPVPSRSLISPLYTSWEHYRSLPVEGRSRAVFVNRDPRDIVMSWYYAMKESHVRSGAVRQIRSVLKSLGRIAGIRYAVNYLDSFGVFRTIESWLAAGGRTDVLIVKYGDLAGNDGEETLGKIMEHFDVRMSKPVISDLYSAYSFRRLTGRDRSTVEEGSSMRGGERIWAEVAGDEDGKILGDRVESLVDKGGFE